MQSATGTLCVPYTMTAEKWKAKNYGIRKRLKFGHKKDHEMDRMFVKNPAMLGMCNIQCVLQPYYRFLAKYCTVEGFR